MLAVIDAHTEPDELLEGDIEKEAECDGLALDCQLSDGHMLAEKKLVREPEPDK